MRTLNTSQASYIAASQLNPNRPYFRMKYRDDLLRFSAPEAGGEYFYDKVPLSVARASATTISLAGFTAAYALRVGTDTTADFVSLAKTGAGFTTAAVGSLHARSLRGSWSGGRYYFMEWNWGSAPALRSVNASGGDLSSSILITGLPNTEITGEDGKYLTLVRPAAVMRMASGEFIIAYSSYQKHENIDQMVATINFYYAPSTGGAATLLNTVLQYDMDDVGYAQAVYGTSNQHVTYDPGASRVQAASFGQKKFLVIANDGTKAVRFLFQNGIEGMAEPIVPIDLDANRLQITESATGKKVYAQYNTFMPTSLTSLGGNYVLNGVMTRTYSNGDCNTMDIYLTSTDGENWSIGEVSSFIHSYYTKYEDKPNEKLMNFCLLGVFDDTVNGAVVKRVYALGNNAVSYAKARDRDVDPTSDGTDFTDIVLGGTIQMASNSSDAVNFQAIKRLNTMDTAQEMDPEVVAGKTVSIEAGFLSDNGTENGAKIAEYVVEAESKAYNVFGRNPSMVSGIDFGSWRLTRWFSVTDIDRWSSTMMKDEMKMLSKIIVKGIHSDYKVLANATAQGMYLKNLNDPLVALTTTKDDRDGMFLASVYFNDTKDSNHLSSVGIIFGAEDYTDIYTNGKRDRKGFNAYMVPVENAWTNHVKTAPQMRVSNLRRRGDDPDTENVENDRDLAWIWKRRYTSLWEREEYTTGTIDPKRTITVPADPSGVVHAPSFTFAKNQEYEVVGRKQGGRVQLFARKKSRDPQTMTTSDFYQYTRIGEYQFGKSNRMSWGPRPYWGFTAGTDTFTTVEGWNAAEYENIETTLTEAFDTDVFIFDQQLSRFNQLVVSGGWAQSTVGSAFACVTFTTWPSNIDIKVGETVRLRAQNGEFVRADYLARVVAIYKTNGNPNRVEFDFAWTGAVNRYPIYNTNPELGLYSSFLFKVDVSPSYGFATSGMVTVNAVESNDGSTTNTTVTPIEIKPGAPKQKGITAGRGAFINRSNDAMSIRLVETDGSVHKIFSGSLSGLAWDPETSPVSYPYTSGSPTGYISTREWRLVMHQGRLLPISTSQLNVPSGDVSEGKRRYMIKGDEIVRYVNFSAKQRGSDSQYTNWCIIPTYYTPIFPSQKGSQTIQQWSIETSYGSGAWKAIPGDRFSDIPSYMLPGLRLTIQTKNDFASLLSESNYYAVSASAGNGTSVASTLTFAPALETGAENVDPNLERQKDYDKQVKELAVLSGRNQFGSPSTGLGVGEPLCYYPIGPDETSNFDHLIRVNYWQLSCGLYNSAKENIRFICNLAGIRDVTFQDKVYTVAKGTTKTLDEQGVALSQSSFVLEIDGEYGGGRFIEVRLRSAYYVKIGVSESTINLELGILAGFQKAVTASIPNAQTSAKILAAASIPVSPMSIEGEHKIRFVAKKERISVEMDHMPVWTFDLNEYTYGGAISREFSLYEEKAGPIVVKADAVSDLTVTWVELSDEVENQIVDMSMGGGAALQFITGERHIYARTTQNGGLHFSRFLDGNRSTPTTDIPTERYIQDQIENNPFTVPGHILVTGAEYAESIDPAWIRENGYMFGTGQNRLLDTVEDSIREAKLLMRMAKEDSEMSNIVSRGMIHLHPEDQITKKYTDPEGNITEQQVIVVSHTVEFGAAKLSSTIQARTKYNMV